MTCWNCKKGEYVTYASDFTQTPRCGQCGELERDDPTLKKVEPATTKAPTKRVAAKPKEKA